VFSKQPDTNAYGFLQVEFERFGRRGSGVSNPSSGSDLEKPARRDWTPKTELCRLWRVCDSTLDRLIEKNKIPVRTAISLLGNVPMCKLRYLISRTGTSSGNPADTAVRQPEIEESPLPESKTVRLRAELTHSV
jgi:hypothetical protein